MTISPVPPVIPPYRRAGDYAGFDTTAPTSRDGGKPEVVRRLKAARGYETVVMIGAQGAEPRRTGSFAWEGDTAARAASS